MKYPDTINNNTEPQSKAEEPMMATYIADAPHEPQRPFYDMDYAWEVVTSLSPEQKEDVAGRLTEEATIMPNEEKEFDTLFDQWLESTAVYSGPGQYLYNGVYSKILLLGETAIEIIDKKLSYNSCAADRHLRWLKGMLQKSIRA